jgi:hypothetical protein
METNPFTLAGAVRSTMQVASGKRRNTPDGRIWPTEGRYFAPAGRRYVPLVVNQTTARSMPGKQTGKIGQMGQ